MRVSPAAAVLGAVGVTAGVVGVAALREATLSTHQPVPEGSRVELVVSAEANGAEPGQTLEELVDAQVRVCRLEVTSDVVGGVEPVGSAQFRFVLSPAMDETNRRQFRGCLEDWTVDHLRLDVETLDDIGDEG
ncbi:MAG: hypothetical protein ACRD0R_01250 [Acidimicrobiales bacterium]|nr:hypothetical protein [Pedococcus sp.]